MSLAMTKQEREAFLADLHVGVISIDEPGRGPLTVPIWYDYQPGGELWIITDRGSRKGKLLDAAGRFSLCAQTESPPYKYVTVEGPIVSAESTDMEGVGRSMAHRYLGPELGDQYVEATRADAERGNTVCFRMRPEHWLTVDYAKQFAQL
jgi:nitroimidazol reductase NimA-like FMN-containing flavoprotein (pyridoxamine 5'-phosphate oxidase superfamily)